MIVVLGSRFDPHVSRVADRFDAEEVDYRIVDFLSEQELWSLHQDERGTLRLIHSDRGQVIPTLIWDRVKLLPGTDMYPKGSMESAGYLALEWRALYNLITTVWADRAVNPPSAKRKMLKPFQQALAAKVGFLVPQTLITTSRAEAIRFCEDAGGSVVMKSLSGGKIQPKTDGEGVPFNIMTMRVSAEDVASAEPAQISCAPHFFQREISKSFELRVVVVDNDIFAFKINSQNFKSTELDWRNGIQLLDFSPIALSSDVLTKIRLFMKAIGYTFGSLDFIVDTSGDLIFLECNEDGQWAWLDDRCDMAISAAYASVLPRLAENSSHSAHA
jgi:hypothetical protein